MNRATSLVPICNRVLKLTPEFLPLEPFIETCCGERTFWERRRRSKSCWRDFNWAELLHWDHKHQRILTRKWLILFLIIPKRINICFMAFRTSWFNLNEFFHMDNLSFFTQLIFVGQWQVWRINRRNKRVCRYSVRWTFQMKKIE